MSNNNNRQLGEAPWLHVIISTGFGSGFFPKAPGTAGAFVGLVMWYIGYLYLEPNVLTIVTIAAIILTTFIGVWTSNVMEKYWGEDPRAVVIDEYVGTWIPLLIAPCGKYTWIIALLGFAFFRLIDIFKPLGCRWVDTHVKGGWGVMLDDVLAGFYALILCFIIKQCFAI
ncbi:phosphatidylglycerophosphatase A [Bacteroides sp. HPS0048]|uniref:phosphatidylglycerophosphatase A family protein n=1 Tax=Bacteroides sp. HPS0048 TaxID=1078089 RepID=UPI00037ADB2B|nr:phosphatidylglycerophosphatase A [Bacteroides sp. HPS0048]EOA58469.1 phosphatidylglycerophosphatase A [Bacteroides sp. HPS0048]